MVHEFWRIGRSTGGTDQFAVELFKVDGPDLEFRVGRDDPAEAWPEFHPGPLDSHHGFREHSISVVFDVTVEELPENGQDLELEMHATASHGPCPDLHIFLNGERGNVELRPRRKNSGFSPFPPSAISAPVHETVPIPGCLLRAGTNVLTFTTHGPGPADEEALHPAQLPYLGSWFGSGLTWTALRLGTTRRSFELDVAVVPTPLFVDRDGQLMEIVDVTLAGSELPQDGSVELRVHGIDPVSVPIIDPPSFGSYTARLEVPDLRSPQQAHVTVSSGEHPTHEEFVLEPCRHWTLHLFPHVHLDLGYTDAQAKVIELHSRNLDRALSVCEQDPSYRFTVDGSIILDHFVRTRTPEQVAGVRRLISEGRVGVNRFDLLLLSGFASRDEVIDALDGEHTQQSSSHRCAHLTDVPSYSSALPGLLKEAGVDRFFGIANHTRGGNEDSDVLHLQSPFVWEGNEGSRVIAFFSDCYSQLRFMCADPPSVAGLEDAFVRFTALYERPDYPLGDLPIVGTHADNEDLALGYADIVRRWNTKYAFPRLIFSTPAAYFDRIQAHEAELPLWTGDGGSFWEDGMGAAAAVVATQRRAQAALPVAQMLQALVSRLTSHLTPDLMTIDSARNNLLIGSEHTWTSAHATEHSEGEQATAQLAWKKLRVDIADDAADGLVKGALSQLGDGVDQVAPALLLVNPTPWPRHLEAVIETDDLTVAGNEVEAVVESQVEAPPLTRVRTTRTIPGFSYVSMPLTYAQPTPGAWVEWTGEVLETNAFQALIDPQRGGLQRLVAKGSGTDLVHSDDGLRLGQLNYVQGGGGSEDRGLRRDSSRLFDAQPWRQEPKLNITPAGWQDVRYLELPWGLLLEARGEMADQSPFVTRVILPNAGSVTLDLTLTKVPVLAKESVYLSFPFDVPQGRIRYDRQLGWVDPAAHLPGAANEWFTTQHSVVVSNDDLGIAWHSADAPLFTLDFVQGTWARNAPNYAGALHSWIMNNYWWTNVPASQKGETRLRYAFEQIDPDDLAHAGRAGRELRRPPLAQLVTALDKGRPLSGELPRAGSLDGSTWPSNVSADWRPSRRDRDTVVLVLEELGGRRSQLQVRVPPGTVSAALSDGQENPREAIPITKDRCSVTVDPHRLAFVQFRFC